MTWAICGGRPLMKLVESNVPTTLNTSAEAGRLDATPWVGDHRYGLPGRAAGPGQVRPAADGCDASGPRPRHGGASACVWLTGELAVAVTSVSEARGCTRCNEGGWLPAQAHDVTKPSASLAAAVPAGHRWPRPPVRHPVQPAATGCIAMPAAATMMQAAQGHQPHHRCIRSRRAVKSQVTIAAAPWQAEGAVRPHAAPQAARVHANCRMMHQMQFCPFWRRSRRFSGNRAVRT